MRRRVFLTSMALPFIPLTAFGQPAPGGSMPGPYAAFIGTWHGQWGGTLNSHLIVQSVSGSGEFQATYDWATNDVVRQPGSMKVSGNIKDGVLGWTNGKIEFQFRVMSDGRLEGKRYSPSLDGYVIMSKQ